jgi:general secretion pathway protein H
MGLTGLREEKEKIKISRNNPLVWQTATPPLTLGKQSGFTLLELTIVLFLTTLMLGVVGINFYKTWQREQLKMNLRQVVGALRQARSDAVAGNRKVQVRFDLPEHRYWLPHASPDLRPLPPVKADTAQLVWQDQTRRQGHITFYGDGSSSGGRLTFLGTGKQPFILEVDRITGQIHLTNR